MKQFRLSDADKQQLMKFGYLAEDFQQIELAASEVDLFYEDKAISIDRCIELIGRKRFLSGIARAAFHWTASRVADNDESVFVFFDGTAMWKRWVG